MFGGKQILLIALCASYAHAVCMCGQYSSSSSCPQPGCKWVNDQCLSLIEAAAEAQAPVLGACSTRTSLQCSGTCIYQDSKCVDFTQCSQASGAGLGIINCLMKNGCYINGTTCQSFSKCSDVPIASCLGARPSNNAVCMVSGTSCFEYSGCGSLNNDQCGQIGALAGCALSGGSCQQMTCASMTTEVTCNAFKLQGCAFTNGKCNPIVCSTLTGNTNCEVVAGCMFNDKSCQNCVTPQSKAASFVSVSLMAILTAAVLLN